MTELNGDERLRPADRLRYLWQNALRGLRDLSPTQFAVYRHWRANAAARAALVSESPSPGRARELLARAGFHGTYTGVDVSDRFDRERDTAFASSFQLMDAHDLESGARFDLVFSNSALEHIPDDTKLIAHLRTTLRPGGIQLHIIPSGAALYAYLWHGYRQYARGAVTRRFLPDNTSVFALGGMFSLLLHMVFITVPEMLLRLPVRQKASALYRPLMRAAIQADRFAPFGAVMYGICERAPDGDA